MLCLSDSAFIYPLVTFFSIPAFTHYPHLFRMKQALSEIFQNLKEIQQDTKKRREKLNLQRRRGSAPATALRETAATFKQPKKLDRSLSTAVPAASSTLSTMRWVLQCFEEEEEEKKKQDDHAGSGSAACTLITLFTDSQQKISLKTWNIETEKASV